MASVPTTPPKTRSASLQSLVRQAEGDDWHKTETSYEFSNGRKFKSTDGDTAHNGGIYSSNPEG